MRIVTYRDLRPGRFAKPLERLRAALARGDFAAAGLKKLAPTPFGAPSSATRRAS